MYENREHPVSAVLVDLCEATPEEMKRRGYCEIPIPVTTVDAVLAEHNLKRLKLVSATTNRTEIEIVGGMKSMLSDITDTYISLAVTGDRYRETMNELGFEYVYDDRGFTFFKNSRLNAKPISM